MRVESGIETMYIGKVCCMYYDGSRCIFTWVGKVGRYNHVFDELRQAIYIHVFDELRQAIYIHVFDELRQAIYILLVATIFYFDTSHWHNRSSRCSSEHEHLLTFMVRFG